MTTSRTYERNEGDFGPWQLVPVERGCPKCGKPGQWEYRTWDSHDGGYQDEEHHCFACGTFWWVDGPDA